MPSPPTQAGAELALGLFPEDNRAPPPAECATTPVDKNFYYVLLPLAGFAWNSTIGIRKRHAVCPALPHPEARALLTTLDTSTFHPGASIRQIPLMCTASVLAYLVSHLAAPLGVTVSNILSAFALGTFSNLSQRITPASIPLVPTLAGLLVLVPGAMAVRSVQSMLTDGVAQGASLTLMMLFAAVTLGLGLFLSSLVVTPDELVRLLHGHIRRNQLDAATF